MSATTLAARVTGARPGPWTAFLLRRTGRLLVSLVALVTASFLMIPLVPGDPVRAALGLTASPESIKARKHELGLDQPLFTQYGDFVRGLFNGDLGQSISARVPVSQLIGDRLPATLELALIAFVIAMLVAVPLGMAM